MLSQHTNANDKADTQQRLDSLKAILYCYPQGCMHYTLATTRSAYQN